MKNLLKSNKFMSSFYEVFSSPLGDESISRSHEPMLEIKMSNPLREFDRSLSTNRIAGI